MFCPHCGTRLEEDGNFCPFCGGSLREEEEFFQTPEENIDHNSGDSSYGTPEDVPPYYNSPDPESYNGADQEPFEHSMPDPCNGPEQFPYDQPVQNHYGQPGQNHYDGPGDNFYRQPQNTVNSPDTCSHSSQNQWMIGRSKTCDIVIHSNRVSRRHCLITRTPDGIFVIEDLGSTNGTFLNGMPLQGPTQLYPGDQLAFADTQFTFQIDQGFPILV